MTNTDQFFNNPSDKPNLAEKTLAILKMHQNKKKASHGDQRDESRDKPIQQSNPPKFKVVRKKPRVEVREYMLAKGLQPSPLEFYKLVVNDSQLTDFFCYCNRKSDFYDFEVTAFDEKNEDDYLTVSKRGVVHFLKGEPNFIPILDWERELQIF